MDQPESASRTIVRSRVVAWALWDSGSTGLNAIVATFVFSVYLTSSVGVGIAGGTSPASWLGRAGAAAGLTIAVLAPAVGVYVESPAPSASGAGRVDRPGGGADLHDVPDPRATPATFGPGWC